MRRLTARLKRALLDLHRDGHVSVQRYVYVDGRRVKGSYDPADGTVRIGWAEHSDAWDMVQTMVHEALHHAGGPEWTVDGVLDTVAMRSPSVRALAALVVLDAVLAYLHGVEQ